MAIRYLNACTARLAKAIQAFHDNSCSFLAPPSPDLEKLLSSCHWQAGEGWQAFSVDAATFVPDELKPLA